MTGSLDIGTKDCALLDVRDVLKKKFKCDGKAWSSATQSEIKRSIGLRGARKLYGWKS